MTGSQREKEAQRRNEKMQYECSHHSYGLSVDTGLIQFRPNADGFGEFDTSLKSVQEKLRMTDKQLQEVIESEPLFTDCVRTKSIGKHGTWRKLDRLGRQEREQAQKAIATGLAALDEDTLRQIIAAKGGECPVECNKERLVAIAVALADPAAAKPTNKKTKKNEDDSTDTAGQ